MPVRERGQGKSGQPKTGGARQRRGGGRGGARSSAAAGIAHASREAAAAPETGGLASRRLAVELVEAVLVAGRALDEAMDALVAVGRHRGLESRDKGFARLIAATVLRRLGSLEATLGRFIERPLPASARRAHTILLIAAAQLLLIGTPAHAAINLAVTQCRGEPKAARFDKLANAVLRRVATEGPAVLAGLETPRIDVPEWLWDRWVAAYGRETASRIAAASLVEAPLDLSVKADAEGWAVRLGARLLDTSSLRLDAAGRVEELAGYSEGGWWVQDAAAAVPARLLGAVEGLAVADLCAAPGGKTAELAAMGARVTAIDISRERLERLEANMARLGLSGQVETVAADLTGWQPGRLFDAVLLDVPCTATGTVRRHPDILRLKRPGDAARLATLQRELILSAARLVKPGGRLVYCVCSLEPEEGEAVVAAFLAGNAEFAREAILAGEVAGHGEWLTPAGDLRTLPCHEPAAGAPGMDGFYAARLVRQAG